MDELYLIAGLGNPGREYERTRHNAGFLVAERFAKLRRVSWSVEERLNARVARAQLDDRRLILCEPLTFMNASGEAVSRVLNYFRVSPARLMVVVDDADLPLGQLRLKPGGSSGGHHGLESVEQHLGLRDYARLRVGIGRTADGRRDIAGHVLGKFSAAEEPMLEQVLSRCCQQLECWLRDGLAKAMNQFNGALSPEPKKATE